MVLGLFSQRNWTALCADRERNTGHYVECRLRLINLMGENLILSQISSKAGWGFWHYVYGSDPAYLIPTAMPSVVWGGAVKTVGIWCAHSPTPKASRDTWRAWRPALNTPARVMWGFWFINCRGYLLGCFLEVVCCDGRYGFEIVQTMHLFSACFNVLWFQGAFSKKQLHRCFKPFNDCSFDENDLLLWVHWLKGKLYAHVFCVLAL